MGLMLFKWFWKWLGRREPHFKLTLYTDGQMYMSNMPILN